MASGPITSSQIDFLGSKVTADGDCRHEIKRCLLLGRKAMPNLESVLKSRDITLSTKVHIVKAMVFPVVMYGCESWTIKKAECQTIDAFELWCWRDSWGSLGLQGVQTSHPKGNKFWIYIGGTDAEAEAAILWPPDTKSRIIERDPDSGKGWGQEEKGTTEDQMVGWHCWLTVMSLSELWEMVKDREACCAALCPRGHKESDMTERLNNNKVKLSPVKTKHIRIVPNFLPFRSP